MQRMLYLALTITLCAVSSPAVADLTVVDHGWEITVSNPDGRMLSQKDNGFAIKATGNDIPQGIAIANQKAERQAKELNEAMNAIVRSGLLCAPPRPATTHPPACAPCAPRPTACQPPAGVVSRLVTLSATWTGDGIFHATVDGRVRTFIVPAATRAQYAHRPETLSGWLYNCPRRSGCPLVFRDMCTCIDFLDP